jgi:hypothetical protein
VLALDGAQTLTITDAFPVAVGGAWHDQARCRGLVGGVGTSNLLDGTATAFS